MRKQELSALSTEELQKKEKVTKGLTGMLAVALIVLFGLYLYITIQKGFTPLLILPIALMPILIVNIKNIQSIKKELERRKP